MLVPLVGRSHSIPVILGALLLHITGALAQQTSSQLPEPVRGAKIYQLPTRAGESAANPVVYKSLTYRDINPERLLLALSLSVKPVDRSATIQRIYFQNVKINGIPVHIDTFNQEFKLSNKETVDLPAPLECTLVFSDLDSMQPVRDMVDKDNIQVTGQSFIDVKLSSLEKLALRTKQVVIPVDLNEQVPLNLFQDNPLLRATADTILDALADPHSAAAITMAKQHLDKLRVSDAVGAKVNPALYLLYTQFTVRDPKSHSSEQFSLSGTGFIVSADGKLLTTKRVVQPWKFDPQIDFLLEHQHLELDKDSVKIYAWPAGAQVLGPDGQPDFHSALSTDKQSLKVLPGPPDEIVQQDYQDPESQQNAALHLHAEGTADLALLQITGSSFQPLSFADPPQNLAGASQLTLCSYPFGISQRQSAPHLVSVKVTAAGGTLKMEHGVEPGESGGALLDAKGRVAALAASANQCIPIQAARNLMP